MSNKLPNRLETKKATTEQLKEFRKDAKTKYTNIKNKRSMREIKRDEKIAPSKEELEWRAELRRLNSAISYRGIVEKNKILKESSTSQ